MVRARGAFAAAVLATVAAFASPATAQQVADSAFVPTIAHPAWAAGKGPLVLLDEAHHNFHTKSGRYAPFARALEADGFVVRANAAPFTAEALRGARVLVVSNALNAVNETTWVVPTPSAFTPEEIRAVRAFVEDGGALFLIADHMPFAGAASDLGTALGVTFDNGFAMVRPRGGGGPDKFRRGSGGGLGDHAITRAVAGEPAIDSVATFTGSAFRPPANATSLLTLPDSAVSLAPDTAWVFSERTKKTSVSGWSQGAVFELGKGRVAVFGEAAMFSAQRGGPQGTPMGMNSPQAAQNPTFLLRLVRWLATGSPAGGPAPPRAPRAARGQSAASK
jgi:hypothetical protein